jgi:uncharacterized protein YcbK (DUF882 family)
MRPATTTRRRLSPHFVIEEFDCHDGTLVPSRAIASLADLCLTYLEPLRERYGPVTVHSGFRTEAYNRSIHGATASFHIYTLRGGQYVAADVEPQKGSVQRWVDFIDRMQHTTSPPHGGLGRYMRGGFVHVDNRPYLARWDGS